MTPYTDLRIPGWDVTEEDGTLTAKRRGVLSEYERLHGALDEMSANHPAELWHLCEAQRRYVQLLKLAERAHPKMQPAPVVCGPVRSRRSRGSRDE